MITRWTALGLVVLLAGCNCGPARSQPDAGPGADGGPPPKPDSGIIVLPPDGSVPWPETKASEPCPPEAYGQYADEDGGMALPAEQLDGSVKLGLCVALRTLTAEALLNAKPVAGSVNLQFLGGGFRSEIDRNVDAQGRVDAKVMRSRYDILKYQPSGVFPTHEGHEDFGFLDMTRDQQRSLSVRSHSLRGAAYFGGLPFTPNRFPQDVWLEAYGLPQAQKSAVTSNGGSYQLSFLEGTFALFLSTPSTSLFGTELRGFQLNTSNVIFDRDQEFDIDIATSLLEGQVTLDGAPVPDRRVGADYSLEFIRPGDRDATIITRHEGGVPDYAALVPKGQYAVVLSFEAAPDRHLPSQIWNKPLTSYIDLATPQRLSANLATFNVEGGFLIDGKPIQPNPAYNWKMYMFGFANATDVSSYLLYEVPMESSAFRLRTFPGNYFTVLWIEDAFGEDLAEGFYVIDRYFQVQGDTHMSVSIDTSIFSGVLTIDGQPPPPNKRVGWVSFRNRAMQGQYSWYRRAIMVGEDGTFRVRLPKGEYEVYFTIDREVYPEYAQGRQLMVSRVNLAENYTQNLDYKTVLVEGPLRVQGQVVQDTIGGPEVGLTLTRAQDFQDYDWRFEGGSPNYRLRIPPGDYALDFRVFQNAIDGVAWGNAPMGMKINLKQDGEPLLTLSR